MQTSSDKRSHHNGASMRRFYIQPKELKKQSPAIYGADVRHIKKVLRLEVGEPVVIFDGTGKEFTAELRQFHPDHIEVAVMEEVKSMREPRFELTVAQGFLKDKKMDELVRHLTEFGMSKWMPVISSRSIPHPNKTRMNARIERWKTIAVEALKQCGGNRIPEILAPVDFDEALSIGSSYDIRLIFWEDATERLERLPREHRAALPRILAIMGPEGGLSPEEVDRARAAGFTVSSLGPRILRAETAAISACALIQYLYG